MSENLGTLRYSFQAHGVKNIFTLVGGHISPILVACEKLGIRVVDTRHEVSQEVWVKLP